MKKKIAIISLIIIVLDQILKIVVDNYLLENINIIDNFFSLHKVYNKGAAFSILNNQIFLLIIINLMILVFIYRYINNFKKNNRNIIAFSLIIGGLIGNLIDRIIYGHVIDYLKFVFGSYEYPVFNLADMCIVVGTFLLMIAVIKKEDENEVRN